MCVREDTDGSLLQAVNAARRAVVFLTVPWSGPERRARLAFRAAADQLTADARGLGVEYFSLDEDTEWCQTWLAVVGVPQLGSGYPLGAGSILWLEFGRAVSHEIGGCNLTSGGIVARTRGLWTSPPEPFSTAQRRGM